MNLYKIKNALKIQQKIEGNSAEIKLLIKILPKIKSTSQWQALTTIKHHRYGNRSYEVYIFYYPSSLLKFLGNI